MGIIFVYSNYLLFGNKTNLWIDELCNIAGRDVKQFVYQEKRKLLETKQNKHNAWKLKEGPWSK